MPSIAGWSNAFMSITGVCSVVSASPLFGSFEGGATISIEVSSTCNLTTIELSSPSCGFGSKTVNATVLDSMHVECVMPALRIGDVTFEFHAKTADYGDLEYKDTFTACELYVYIGVSRPGLGGTCPSSQMPADVLLFRF